MTAVWLALAVLVWLGALGWSRWRATRPGDLPSWQAPVAALTDEQQRVEAVLREALATAERTRPWPATLGGFRLMQQRTTLNYTGTAAGLAWLVLLLEPAQGAPKDTAQPDDEHHLLPDGTMLHVTVWTRAADAGVPEQVTAFPAAEGWVQRVRR